MKIDSVQGPKRSKHLKQPIIISDYLRMFAIGAVVALVVIGLLKVGFYGN